MKPVILVFIKGLGLGGAEKLIADGARYWNRDRYAYHVAYLLPWKDQLVGALRNLDVPVTCVGGRRGIDLLTPFRLRRVVRRLGAQLVHAHLPGAGVLARLAAGVPVVYTEHNLVDSYRQPTRLLNRATYALNHSVVAVSSAVAESAAAYRGPARVVIENGVSVTSNPDDALSARRELGLSNEQPVIVHIGNIRPHKGHDTLLSATAVLSKARPDALVVSIGGEKRAGDLDRLRTSARELGVAANIRFLGRREDALAFVAAADVFVNPSDAEGLPLAVLEAQALARPVVATRVGGVPSIVTDGVSGRLIEPKDPQAMAAAIMDLLDDEATARLLGEEGRRRVEASHGLKNMVTRYERIYDNVIGR